MSAVGENHRDPASPPTRSAGADLKQLTEERMCWVDNPDSGRQSFEYCGVVSCSAILPWLTPFSTASSTTPIASSSKATACASKRRRKSPSLDPTQRAMEEITTDQRATRHPGRHQSERPADFDRNRWPTSIGMPGRYHRNPQRGSGRQRSAPISWQSPSS